MIKERIKLKIIEDGIQQLANGLRKMLKRQLEINIRCRQFAWGFFSGRMVGHAKNPGASDLF